MFMRPKGVVRPNCAFFATLVMQRVEATESFTTSIFVTIQKLQHKVQTTFEDSDETFGGDEWSEVEALTRVGQGNGAGMRYGPFSAPYSVMF